MGLEHAPQPFRFGIGQVSNQGSVSFSFNKLNELPKGKSESTNILKKSLVSSETAISLKQDSNVKTSNEPNLFSVSNEPVVTFSPPQSTILIENPFDEKTSGKTIGSNHTTSTNTSDSALKIIPSLSQNKSHCSVFQFTDKDGKVIEITLSADLGAIKIASNSITFEFQKQDAVLEFKGQNAATAGHLKGINAQTP